MDTNLIGEIAERYVIDSLLVQGFSVCRYGNDVRRANAGYDTEHNLPVMGQFDLKIPLTSPDSAFKGISGLETLDAFSKGKIKNPDFSVSNFLVNEFIQRYYHKYFDEQKNKGNPPHHHSSYLKFKDSKNKKQRMFFEQCKQENQAWHNANTNPFPGGGSHPGKFDFIACKDGEFSAVEVKGNSSRLTYWQSVRLYLLKKMGFCVYVYWVKLGPENILNDINVDDCSGLVCPLAVSDELFSEVINYRALHEVSDIGKSLFIKKYSGIIY